MHVRKWRTRAKSTAVDVMFSLLLMIILNSSEAESAVVRGGGSGYGTQIRNDDCELADLAEGNTGSSGSEQLQVSLDCNTVEWTVQHQDTATTTEHCRIYYYQVSVHAADGYGHGGATAAAGDSVSVYLLNSSATSGSIMLDLTPGARYLLVVSAVSDCGTFCSDVIEYEQKENCSSTTTALVCAIVGSFVFGFILGIIPLIALFRQLRRYGLEADAEEQHEIEKMSDEPQSFEVTNNVYMCADAREDARHGAGVGKTTHVYDKPDVPSVTTNNSYVTNTNCTCTCTTASSSPATVPPRIAQRTAAGGSSNSSLVDDSSSGGGGGTCGRESPGHHGHLHQRQLSLSLSSSLAHSSCPYIPVDELNLPEWGRDHSTHHHCTATTMCPVVHVSSAGSLSTSTGKGFEGNYGTKTEDDCITLQSQRSYIDILADGEQGWPTVGLPLSTYAQQSGSHTQSASNVWSQHDNSQVQQELELEAEDRATATARERDLSSSCRPSSNRHHLHQHHPYPGTGVAPPALSHGWWGGGGGGGGGEGREGGGGGKRRSINHRHQHHQPHYHHGALAGPGLRSASSRAQQQQQQNLRHSKSTTELLDMYDSYIYMYPRDRDQAAATHGVQVPMGMGGSTGTGASDQVGAPPPPPTSSVVANGTSDPHHLYDRISNGSSSDDDTGTLV